MRADFTRANFSEARHLVLKYVCATCWGPLVERIEYPDSFVECAKSDEDCSKTGFVTKSYAERRHAEDHGDAYEAKQNLPFLKKDAPADPGEIIKDITGG